MKNHIYTTKSICIAMLLTMLFPLAAKAGCDIKFADFKLNDSIQCKIPLQKDNIMVSFDDEGCKLDTQQGTMSISKGTSITIKSQNGEKITGVRLVVSNDNGKGDSSDSKRKKTEIFSCDNGEFDNGIWKGSSDAVTFQSLGNCTIAEIRTSLSTDQKEAYVIKGCYSRLVNGYDEWVTGDELSFQFDEKKHLYDSDSVYIIENDSEYPEWYEDDCIFISFDSSFVHYHPKRTSHWFHGKNCEINGIENLNTSEVTDMSYMFANFTYKQLHTIFFDIHEGEYATFSEENYCNHEELFFSSLFENFDFSNVKDMNHMFSGCDMFGFTISSPVIPSNADLSGIFEKSKIKYITIDSSSVNLRNDIFDSLGSDNDEQLCVIDAPEDFNFGVDTSTESFIWKGGRFKGYKLQGYVAVEHYFHYEDAPALEDDIHKEDIKITFYYDTNRYKHEKNGYSYGGYNPLYNHPHYYGESFRTYTYNLSDWEDNKPSLLFKASYNHEEVFAYDVSICIDKSFSDFRPKSTRKWFELANTGYVKGTYNKETDTTYDCLLLYIRGAGTAVKGISGLNYLNTSETTNTERMFYGLCRLESLDLSHLDFSKVTNSKDMFGDCYSLTNLKCNSTLTLEKDTDENGKCAYYVLDDDIITFFFDDKIKERNGQLLEGNERFKVVNYIGSECYLFWDSYDGKHAIIDPSFAQRPAEKTVGWFSNNSSLEFFHGLENLHSTDMSVMFYECNNLKSIDLENCDMSMIENTDYLFTNCKNLTEITIPNNLSKIGKFAFNGCSSLTSVTIPTSVTKIGVSAFAGCTNLPVEGGIRYADTYLVTAVDKTQSTYSIKEGTRFIGESAFYGCSSMSSIAIPNSVTSIGNSAFSGCSKLTSVTVYNPIPVELSTYSSTFSNRMNATLYVPYGSKSAYLAAEHWKEFKKIIELPADYITFADSNTKSLCVSKWDTNGDGELSKTESAAVTSLGTTFKKSQIASFNELQYFTGLTSISDGAFSKSTVGAITLPENITSIGKEAFLDCKSLTSINIPSKVQTIGQNALSGCTAMTSITVDDGNTAFCSVDDVLFSKDKTTLVQFPAAKATAYDVPEGTKTIGRDAFYVSKLKTVTLPASIEELGFDAFGYSNSLEALEIPEGVTTIGDYILDHCTALKALHIPSTVTSIGEYMCNGCNALTDVYCEMTTPLAIAKNNFTATAYSNATLHVPAFAVDAYKDTEGWKYFQNIVGDMASNILLADALTINVGKTENLIVNLSNSTEIDGVQFDITLPAGLDLYVDEEGDHEISTTTRSKKLKANCTRLSNGNYRFILFSTDRAIIATGEGAIMKIKLACAADAEAGIKEISFSGISLSCVSGNVSVNQYCDDFTTMVTIKKVSDIIGDANGDFAVNITDVMEIVNYILDMTSRTFVFDNADVDRNGVVNITDVMNVVNILLGNAIGYNAPSNAKAMPYDLLRISPEDNGCTLHTTFHTQKVTAMQMTVSLPDDCLLESASLTGEASRTHKVLTRRIDDNRYNIVVFSTNGTTLSTDAPILDLGIRGRGGIVNVENIQCSDINLETLLSADISTVITGIGSIIADGDNGNAPVYNTQGQRMNKPQRGINISEGRKVVVK